MPINTSIDSGISRSEEVQEIIGRPPRWIIRVGTLIIACLVVLFLCGAWFIAYPDLVDAPVTFASVSPPVQLAAHSNGRLHTLYVHDGEDIKAGQVIGVLENAAATSDIFQLARVAQALDTTLNLNRTIASLRLPTAIQVGDLQADYANLYQAINTYNFFLSNHNYSDQLFNLRAQINHYNSLNLELANKHHSLNEQLALEYQKDSINNILLKQRVIAKLNYKDNHKIYIDQKLSLDDNNMSIIQNKLQQSEYEKSTLNLQHEHDAQQQELQSKIRASAKVLTGRIASWEQQYVLRTPIAGKITFFKIWTPNQYVKADEPIFVTVPPLNSQYVRASLPVFKAGKVKAGQTAIIKLDEYPFQEFGLLRGIVEKVSAVALDKNYLITIRLSSLRTTTGHSIPLRAELSGTAQIVTEDRNIIQRIFSQVYSQIKK